MRGSRREIAHFGKLLAQIKAGLMREFLFVIAVMFIGNCAVSVVDYVVYHYVTAAAFTESD